MRILWFINAPISEIVSKPISGGWLEAMRVAIEERHPEIELGIVSCSSNDNNIIAINNTTYFNIKYPGTKSKIQSLVQNWRFKQNDSELMSLILPIIKEFKPDLIHIHGTEMGWGLVSSKVVVPTVISIQGILLASYPHTMCDIHIFDYFGIKPITNFIKGTSIWHYSVKMKNNSIREEKIIHSNKIFLGRTEWDKSIILIMNPKAKYYHVGEILKSVFYHNGWRQDLAEPLVLFSASASSPLRGTIFLLRAVSLLIDKYPNMKLRLAGDYSWGEYPSILKKRIKQYKIQKNVSFLGRLSSLRMFEELKKAQVFIQPSCIDNSPNALCEAMLVGVPCIASYAGGIPSLLTDRVDGLLYNPTDPYDLAGKISTLFDNHELQIQFSNQARKTAANRHNPQIVTNQLIDVYEKVLSNSASGQ